jgi:hypothetical protein
MHGIYKIKLYKLIRVKHIYKPAALSKNKLSLHQQREAILSISDQQLGLLIIQLSFFEYLPGWPSQVVVDMPLADLSDGSSLAVFRLSMFKMEKM